MRNFLRDSFPVCFLSRSSLLLYHRGTFLVVDMETGQLVELVKFRFSPREALLSNVPLLARVFRKGVRCGIKVSEDLVAFVIGNTIYELDVKQRRISAGFSPPGKSRALYFSKIEGLCGFRDGLYFGEYKTNDSKDPISIYRRTGTDEWEEVFRFEKGTIEHVHNLIPDPYRNVVYILTGDFENSAGIWVAKNNFKSVRPVLLGKQEYRGCAGFVTPEGLVYSTDSPYSENSIRLLRQTGRKWESVHLRDINGPSIYGCRWGDDFVFSTSVEGGTRANSLFYMLFGAKRGSGVKDNCSHIYKGNLKDGFSEFYRVGKDRLPYFLFQFGALLFPSGTNESPYLPVYHIATKKNGMNTLYLKKNLPNLDQKMEILYASPLCSEKKIDFLCRTGKEKPEFAVQKFHQLLAQGFVQNECKIETLSPCPVNRGSHDQLFWKTEFETGEGIRFHYLPFINMPILRQASIFISGFTSALSWIFRNRNKEKIVVCDILNVAVSSSALLAARLCGVEVVGIVTDIPLVMIPSKDQKRNLFEKIIPVIDDNLNNAYTSYVLLTQQMCRYINRYNRPSCIMEGVVDVNMKSVQAVRDDQVRNILFAGGLVEANGIRQLVEAFRHIKDEDLRLSVYGSGPLEKEMELFMRLDSRLKYYGAVPNAEVMEAELKATLLVNPRFTNAEYTKYSFPSKNLEYMASGVPVLTTCLPGMPKDYYDHIYLFRDESLQGYIKTLSQVLALPEDELKAKGRSAKDFVLREKNNISQTAKILEMVRKEGLSVDIRKINFV